MEYMFIHNPLDNSINIYFTHATSTEQELYQLYSNYIKCKTISLQFQPLRYWPGHLNRPTILDEIA